MNTNYEYKVSMLEFCSVYGCYYLCWQRNVGFLRFVLIWITKGSISKAMAFYFTENEPLPIPWYGEDVLPIAPKSGFPKRFAFFKKFAFVFLTGTLKNRDLAGLCEKTTPRGKKKRSKIGFSALSGCAYFCPILNLALKSFCAVLKK